MEITIAKIPFGTAAKEFLSDLEAKNMSPNTIDGYRKDLRLIQRHIENQLNRPMTLKDFTTESIEAFLINLQEEHHYQPVSINRHLSTYRSFSKYCVKKRYASILVTDPIEKRKCPQKERCFLTAKEVEVLIANIKHPHIHACVQTLYFTGLRINECLTLTLDDVDLELKKIHVRHGKGDKERFVPINDKLEQILQNYLTNVREGTGNMFFSLKKTNSLSRQYVNRELNKVTKQLGWNKHVTAHVLRHSFATNLVSSNVNIVAVQKLLGHSSLKTTSFYLHLANEELVDAVSVL
ncbi:tyrosine-type recombinase/integrase [Rummeliibacillus suwonensis]|uniref:tyrosine-type recombinase/integrase n=1 Tax=Rummeliibacillus suwonensis TaxID=1306154 RepID=UPI0011B477AC|nr:tyrosine-type recombinase/integrase [Rummeliibacillus suwonensis]